MKKIIILLLLLATNYTHGTRKNSLASSIEELLAHQVATKEHLLKKSEEKLQELKEGGAKHAQIKGLKQHIKKRRSSLQYYQNELETLTDSNSQADFGSTGEKENKACAKRLTACCKKHYPDLVMGTLYATLAYAVAAEMLKG